MNIDIKGHSGCIIEVIEKDNKLYVKKSSNDPKYIERLYEQGRKQSLDNQDIVNNQIDNNNFIEIISFLIYNIY